VDAFQPNDDYYKYNLHHLTGYNVTSQERDPVLRTAFKQALSIMDKTTGDDINAHFETITYALTGQPRRRDDAIQHLREWRLYRARVDHTAFTDNTAGCDVKFECVPQDQLETIQSTPVGEQTVVIPGTSSDTRARLPLPIVDRPETDFLWQRPPTELSGGEPLVHQFPGIDYLLPYWMLRYYIEVSPRRVVEPFPPWPGPAHR
jgi:hypothetical protein